MMTEQNKRSVQRALETDERFLVRLEAEQSGERAMTLPASAARILHVNDLIRLMVMARAGVGKTGPQAG